MSAILKAPPCLFGRMAVKPVDITCGVCHEAAEKTPLPSPGEHAGETLWRP
jgi:hypothetical protein